MKYSFLISCFLLLFTSAQCYALEKVSLQLQWKHQFEYAGFYAAIEKGFYRAEGLDVELYEVQSGKDIIQEVLSGHKTYGIGYSSLIVDYLQGKPVVFLANIFKHSALVLVAQKEITKPIELKGKRIMGSREELLNSGITLMLSRFNITENDFGILPSTHNLELFINRQVDAMTAFITNEPYRLDKRNIPYTILNPTSYGSQFYDINLFTSQKQLQQNPRRTRAFVRATIKGWKYALSHSDELIDIIMAKYNSQNKSRDSLEYEAKIIKSLVLPNIYPVGSIDCKIVKQMARDFIQSGIVKQMVKQKVKQNKTVNLDDFVYNRHCTSVKKGELFTEMQRQYLESKKKIKLCIDPNWMPFEAIYNGQHVGMTADFMRIFESELDIPITLIPTKNWSQSLEYIKQRRCDILSLTMDTPDRRRYLDFTHPYLKLPVVIATTNDKFFINDVNAIKDKKIGIVKGYAFEEILARDYPGIKLIPVASVDDGLERVSKGDLYAFIGDLNSIAYQIQKNYTGLLKVAGRLDKQWKLSIGVSKNEQPLLDIFNILIANMDEKTRQKVVNEWMAINVNEQVDYSIYFKTLGIIAIIMVFFFYRYRIVSKYNQDLQVLNKKLELLSTTDPMTRLYNRRYIDTCIKNAWNLAQRYQTPFSLILLDVDNFKQVNDVHGHNIGDSVLIDMAKILSDHTRKNDIVGRWGGEEFLIVCQQSNAQSAEVVAEKLRRTIAEYNFTQGLSITSSFGVTEFKPDDSINTLVNRVDKALYQAKDNGKNQVVVIN